ncbi:hypothetical protein MLD38_038237 [Melastoma candidum]|uniref:Uncharacterized protein n=1 Tax=Melastoma candidum TaxID=119954 RepID=A0ACB9KYJ1_9MYRT|nr:hypothetical protein MLD38_038237 [Melastoma candidum]
MPPKPGAIPPPSKSPKPYFFYGPRRPSQHRPTLSGGGLLSSHKVISPESHDPPPTHHTPFSLHDWDPDSPPNLGFPLSRQNPPSPPAQLIRSLSPISRFILDSFRKSEYRWGECVIADLQKLRRVTPNHVAEVLKSLPSAKVAPKFFNWAGKQKGYRHTYSAYNALAYCLCKGGFFRAADRLPELMESHGREPSEKQFEILIRMHIDAGRGLRLYYVYEKMRNRFGCKPRVFLYNRVMDGLVRCGHVDLALRVYKDFREDGLAEDAVTFMTLIKGLCKDGRIEEVLEILGKMRRNLCKPDVFAYTSMIKVLVKGGYLDGSLRVWEEMKKDGVDADVMAYSTLVIGLCKGNRVQEAYTLFEEMKEKGALIDRTIYGALVEGFVADRKVGMACDLLKDLVESGFRADLGIYNSLIEGLCSVHQVDKAVRLMEVIVQEELRPDFRTVNPILVSYAEMNRMDDFGKVLTRMKELQFPVLDDLSKFFESLAGRDEGLQVALKVFEYLKVEGYSSVSIYNILIGASRRVGEIKRALSLFDEMKNCNVEPDSSTYSLAIECFVEVGDIHGGAEGYNKIMELDSLPSVDAYRSLAKGLCKIGEIDGAMLLIRDCLASIPSGPTEFKYSLAIAHACKSGDTTKVMGVLNEMMSEGCLLDEIAYASIIYGTCKRGTIEDARKVFSCLVENDLLKESDMILYDDLLIEHMKKKTADLMVSGLKFFGLEARLKAKGCNLLSA